MNVVDSVNPTASNEIQIVTKDQKMPSGKRKQTLLLVIPSENEKISREIPPSKRFKGPKKSVETLIEIEARQNTLRNSDSGTDTTASKLSNLQNKVKNKAQKKDFCDESKSTDVASATHQKVTMKPPPKIHIQSLDGNHRRMSLRNSASGSDTSDSTKKGKSNVRKVKGRIAHSRKVNGKESLEEIETLNSAEVTPRKSRRSVKKEKSIKQNLRITSSSLRSSSCGSTSEAYLNTVKKFCDKSISTEVTTSVTSQEITTKALPKIQTQSSFLDGNTRRMSLKSSASGSDIADSARKVNKLKVRKVKGRIAHSKKVDGQEFFKEIETSNIAAVSPKPRRLLKKEKTIPVKQKVRITSSSLRSSSCGSSSENSLNPVKLSNEKRSRARFSYDGTSESSLDAVRKRPRTNKVKPLPDDTNSDDNETQPIDKPGTSDDSDKPLLRRTRRIKKGSATNRIKRMLSSKITDSDSDSDRAFEIHRTARNNELKSRLSPHDFNSNTKSSISHRNNCIASVDKNMTKNTEVKSLIERLETVVSKTKLIDPTYIAPPIFEKRERLRTSAFNGNECLSEEDIQSNSEADTGEPSVSRNSSVKKESNKKLETKEWNQIKYSLESSGVEKRKFVQEKLEPVIESLVPYDQIALAIKASVPVRKMGRQDIKTKQEQEMKREEDLKKLKALNFFRCGNCKYDVSKHKWIEHFVDHGGISWIDGFETSINFDDWNEVLRRTINNLKIYKLSVLTCPNCQLEKKSALGHLSHMIVCGESLETIEQRKISCELCNDKFLPFNATVHRNKCPGIKKFRDIDDEVVKQDSSSDEDVNLVDFTPSGRTKRKAVKR